MADRQRWLVLETSGRRGTVALGEGERLVGRTLAAGRRHARDLTAFVKELLDAEGWTARDLTGVIVSRGPGSFTGLRVGIMSAKAFAYAVGAKLVAVDTFGAIAEQSPPEAFAVHILADGQQGKVYQQLFHRDVIEGQWQPDAEVRIVPLDEWIATLGGEAWVSGPGVEVYRNRLPKSVRIVAEDDREPQAASVYRIGLRQATEGNFADVWGLEPAYLRGSYAEENKSDR